LYGKEAKRRESFKYIFNSQQNICTIFLVGLVWLKIYDIEKTCLNVTLQNLLFKNILKQIFWYIYFYSIIFIHFII